VGKAGGFMGDFLARVWEFSIAVATNWLWWVTTVPFFIDQLLSRNFWSKAAVERLSARWPEEERHRFFKMVAVAGFAVASFQAFDHVNTELKTVKSIPPIIAANRWEPLSSNEALALRSNLRKLPVTHLNVLCAFAGCADLADSIFSVTQELNWTGTFEGSYFNEAGIETGIYIVSYPQTNDIRGKIVEAIERATNGRLKIPSYDKTSEAPTSDIASHLELVIGRVKK